ncbi:MAG: S-layer homology domain-containing protein [Thermoanaerobaculia bacterium]
MLTPASAPTGGTTGIYYRTLGYTEFFPLESSVGYGSSTTVNDGRYATSGGSAGDGRLRATLNLPSGALLKTIEFDFCANHPTGGIGLQRVVEDKSGAGNVTIPIMAVVGPVGCMNIVANVAYLNLVIDNNASRIMLQVVTLLGAFDGSATFSGVVVGYELQVSPAPATPTFNDVPTGDPGFQYIEALAASGITAGCGGGNYCPDSSVTRRQMAVFLAKALGLFFN